MLAYTFDTETIPVTLAISTEVTDRVWDAAMTHLLHYGFAPVNDIPTAVTADGMAIYPCESVPATGA